MYLISPDLLQKTLNYLIEKPYKEVYSLIGVLTQLEKVNPAPQEEKLEEIKNPPE